MINICSLSPQEHSNMAMCCFIHINLGIITAYDNIKTTIGQRTDFFLKFAILSESEKYKNDNFLLISALL